VFVSEGSPGEFPGSELTAGSNSGDLIERLGHRPAASGCEPGEIDAHRITIGSVNGEPD
jgi:hypothetical protein